MRSVSAPFEGSGASTMRRYKLAMVLCRASETTSASAKRSTCCHCGLCRCRCKPHTKASSLGECCTMSLSKGISFLLYALVGTPSVHGYPLVFNLGYAQNSPDSNCIDAFEVVVGPAELCLVQGHAGIGTKINIPSPWR